jgi:uncharacterized membrane protein YdjX (TVP38/TMEM64 family)
MQGARRRWFPGWKTIIRDRRIWLAVVIVAVIAVLYLSGGSELLSLDTLRAYRKTLGDLVERHPVASIATYLAVYILATALSVPGAVVLTLAGGFLFGTLFGAAFAVIGATIGAMALFLIARFLMKGRTLDALGPKAASLGEGIRRNAWSYLLALRLVPLFPFFLVNIVPAFVGVKLPVFAVTTLFGIMPGTLVYSAAGAGLGQIFDSGEDFSVGSVLTPNIIVAFAGLALLALVAIPIQNAFAGKR